MRSTHIFFLPLSLCTLAFLLGQGILPIPQVQGLTMKSDNYILEMGNLNSISGKSTGSQKKLGFTSGEIAPSIATDKKSKVKAGFQFIHPLRGFGFSLSQTSIDFGVLSPTNPVTRNTLLTVNNRSSFGYSVLVSANHSLKTANGQVIPDTTCDNGACNEIKSALWLSTLTYGFGYRCDGVSVNDCDTDFDTKDMYKQFADASKGEKSKVVAASKSSGANRQVKVTYKVNIPGTQAPGSYSNTITYIATPTF